VAADEDAERRWPRRDGRFALTKCRAGAIAGSVTGLLAGLGVAIALAKEIDDDWLKIVLGALIMLLAAVGGMLTGAIASGCFSAGRR
jgi:ABC-type antimicrobial peptide transport system permease subunit